MTKKAKILQSIEGGLIVSCQALEDEPLHSSYIMSRMAVAAKEGGAVAIRANGVSDITEIREAVDLPIIGLIKNIYPDSEVYITPTMTEVDSLVKVGADVIALDATDRIRPAASDLDGFYNQIRSKYPDAILMADCSTYEEGIHAAKLGFDIVSTTMSGYTKYTLGTSLPDFNMLSKLVDSLSIPVIAEGGIWEPSQLSKAFEIGCFSAVVGSAITRPQLITARFIDAIKE